MKKIQLIGMVVVVMCIFTGCVGTNYAKDYDKNTLIVKKNASLVEVAVEDFKGSSVKAEDLDAYIEEQITSYNDENGKKIEKQSIDTEDMGNVKLVLTYKDIDSYNDFNLLDCILKNYSDIGESELKGSYTSLEGEAVKAADFSDVDKAKVLMLSEATDVVINGDILYYNKEVSVKDEVATTTGEDTAVIIFK